MEHDEKVYVPDTSAILSGALREAVAQGRLAGRILIPVYVLNYFEEQARRGISAGVSGVRELNLLRDVADSMPEVVELEYVYELPVSLRGLRDLNPDLVCRLTAVENGGVLVTCDELSARVARALGVEVELLPPRGGAEFFLDKLFGPDTMSVHLKEGAKPYAKKGVPGQWTFVSLRDQPLTREEMEDYVRQVFEMVKTSGSSAFVEYEGTGVTIVQLGLYRIVITKPPFSDGIEITATRPVARLRLEDYNLPKKLIERLEKQAEGILIAGAPGMGKTTFAQALAEYYYRKGKVVKTIESPRDMHLPADITQYSRNYATSEEIHDVLLLSRPDYTFFDEMRDTKDFELYADLRLAGVGMVGVVHATSPIDAVQRFIGRVELGMIPSIIDTVIYVKHGRVEKVYSLETTVKIPHGLKEEDLARPVVVVRDFMTGEPEYELYVFGERTFVVPVKRGGTGKVSIEGYKMKNALEKALFKMLGDGGYELVIDENESLVVIKVPVDGFNYLAGKPRRKLERIARRYGYTLEIRPSF
ncbi:PINc/VapC family ATPase [Thermofilum pendens]|uniref:Nucleotide binding protein, PINc n=1 Tax=Thermofilum pendens (strain DSM 2475 / Hrk 5) TaxID=368408 RepID=A1RXL2_THEPD|nr:PINc/VapC family ATPase [Thermofilum pendens]ABL77942.1 Nucleotide binding protein, PINc [Thermofilum pendens Hrk 5]